MRIWSSLSIGIFLLIPTLALADFNQVLSHMVKYENYVAPEKISNHDQFSYVYLLLLDREMSSQISPYPNLLNNKFNSLKIKCDTVGAALSTYDFLKLNNAFASESTIKSYENNEHLKLLVNELGDACKPQK